MRTDSEYAAACMMGRVTPKTNRQLAERLRSLWRRLRAKHTVTWRHVAGHSGNKWNDYVDELAARGRQGDRGSNAAEWADNTIPTDTPDDGSDTEGPAPAPRGGSPRPPGGPNGPLQGATPPGRPAFPVPVLPNQPRRQRELPATLSGSSASRTRPNRGPQTRSALCCP